MTFSDGQTVHIDPADIVVFVGPNNAGKTRALRDIESLLSGQQDGQVVVHAEYSHSDHDAESVRQHIQDHSSSRKRGFRPPILQGFGYSIQSDSVRHRWPKSLTELVGYFVRRIDTDERLSASNPAPNISFRTDPATHPIHLLHQSSNLEHETSNFFRRAFGQELLVDRNAGKVLPLRVGERPTFAPGEQYHFDSYDDRLLEATVPLQEQGDGMRSFATVLLSLFATRTASVALLDEPEAFLHPPQAKLIGRLIATNTPSNKQHFIATHSPHVLDGLLEANETNRLRVIRLDRHGNSNTPHELDKTMARELTNDPLLRQSSAISGVFHKRVIICEGIADSMFYRALLELPQIAGEIEPDVLFLVANGKQRLHSLAKSMVALGVPTDVIADIDILNDRTIVKRTYEALQGNWDSVKQPFTEVQQEINRVYQPLSVDQMQSKIGEIIALPASDFANLKSLRSDIEKAFREVTPWGRIKEGGETSIPSEAQPSYSQLKASFEAVGLWLVPEGELEGFYRNCIEKGPLWVQEVLGEGKLETDPDLSRARDFLANIWQSRT